MEVSLIYLINNQSLFIFITIQHWLGNYLYILLSTSVCLHASFCLLTSVCSHAAILLSAYLSMFASILLSVCLSLFTCILLSDYFSFFACIPLSADLFACMLPSVCLPQFVYMYPSGRLFPVRYAVT